MSEVDEEAERITDLIYKAYGSGTGYLFGIPPDLRYAVEAVVLVVIRQLEAVKEE